MKKFLSVLLIICSQFIVAEEIELYCSDAQTEDPPFYVSDEYRQGDKIWENLRDIEDHTKVKEYIPRGSIVHAPYELTEVSYAPEHRVPIKVISVPDKKWEDDIKGTNRSGQRRRFRHTALTPKGRERAKEGSVGFLDRRALIPAGKFTFFVKESSPLHKSPGGLDLKQYPLSLLKVGDTYQGQNCCEYTETSEEPNCFFKYTFQVLNNKGEALETVNIDPQRCELLKHIMPVPKKDGMDLSLASILKNLNEEYPGFGIGEGIETPSVNLSGIKYLPDHKHKNGRVARDYMIKIPMDPETREGPYNSLHYHPDDDNNSDAYLKPQSMCAFFEVLKKYNQECGEDAGCQVQFGNMYHHPGWGVHESHGSGECIDIRPQRKGDDDNSGLTYTQTSRYSRDKTKKLVDILKEAGGAPIFFNDTKINGVRWLKGHHNHIHVCFNPARQKVKDACRKGI